jgi:S1-C subfamily serine protease
MARITEIILVSVIVVRVGIIIVQSIANSRILSLIGQPQQGIAIPFLSMLMNIGKQLQQQFTGENTGSGYCQNGAATSSYVPAVIQKPDEGLSLITLFKQVENSVVQITSRVSNSDNQIIINGNPSQGATRLGSGFVFDKQGHIITNNHVVEGAKTVDVTFIDGNTYSAKVVGTDPFSDISVIQITDDFSSENLVPLSLTNSSALQVGQQIVAIGNPFGLSDTMTTGIVSQMGRLLPNPDTGFSTPNTIQTDAAINPGNSGGPLLDTDGRVVGINTAISSGTGEFSGVGFAVPSNTIIREVQGLIQNGCYSHGWLGISGGPLTPDVAQQAGLPRNYKGIVIGSIQSGSPANQAGLQGITQDSDSNSQHIGDIIIAIDGHPLKSIDDLLNYLDVHKAVGDKVTLTVNRHGQIMNSDLVLQGRPLSIRTEQDQSVLP